MEGIRSRRLPGRIVALFPSGQLECTGDALPALCDLLAQLLPALCELLAQMAARLHGLVHYAQRGVPRRIHHIHKALGGGLDALAKGAGEPLGLHIRLLQTLAQRVARRLHRLEDARQPPEEPTDGGLDGGCHHIGWIGGIRSRLRLGRWWWWRRRRRLRGPCHQLVWRGLRRRRLLLLLLLMLFPGRGRRRHVGRRGLLQIQVVFYQVDFASGSVASANGAHRQHARHRKLRLLHAIMSCACDGGRCIMPIELRRPCCGSRGG